MTFTNDDLKRLKDEIRDCNGLSAVSMSPKLCRTLLARLEAAENVCIIAEDFAPSDDELMQTVKAWRKACGVK